jgi:DNA-binding MarR family transcriptional regulator
MSRVLASPPEWHIGRALVPLFEEFNNAIIAEMSRAGFGDIRSSHRHVFVHIDDEGTSLTELAARAGVSKQAMVQFVNELEAGGYVRRVPDPHDGRAKLVQTTQKGERALRVSWRAIESLEARWEARLGSRRMAQLRKALRALTGEDHAQ